MQLQTILNRVERHKSFVYKTVCFANGDRAALEVLVHERANGRPICSGCDQPSLLATIGYHSDAMSSPLWAMAVFFVYAPRRVDCPNCGVKVERVLWVKGKSRLTKTFQWFLASCSKLLAWPQVAQSFGTSRRASIVRNGGGLKKHRSLDNIEASWGG